MSDAGSRHLGTMSSDRRASLRALRASSDADAMGCMGIAVGLCEMLPWLASHCTGTQHCRQSAQGISRLDAVPALRSVRQRELGSDSNAIIYISWSAVHEARTQYDISRVAEDSLRQGKKRPLYNNRRRIAQAKPQARISHASVRGDPHRLRALAHLTSCHCSRENCYHALRVNFDDMASVSMLLLPKMSRT